MEISEGKRQEAVHYSVNAIHHICENIGPRESGSKEEYEAELWLEDEIKKNKWADSTEIEDFKVCPKALVGFSKIIGVMLIVGALLQTLWFAGPTAGLVAAILGVLLAVASLTITVFEFLFYKKFIDRFMENKTSHNLYCKYEPTGEVKRRIVFNGHVDSAYEWTLMKIKQNVMVVVLVTDLLCAIATIIIGIMAIVKPATWMFATMAAFAVPYIGLFYVCNFDVVVPGANDNLTGVLNAVSVLKCLSESGIRLENTEVCCFAAGSEEAGLRGADHWAKTHKEEIDSVPTAVLVFDTLRDMDFLTIYARDMTNLVKNDEDCVRLVEKAANEIGHPLPRGGVPFGASDAAALSKNKVKAVCVAGQDPLHANYYHNTRDTADNLRPDTMKLCLDLSLKAVEIFDREGFGN